MTVQKQGKHIIIYKQFLWILKVGKNQGLKHNWGEPAEIEWNKNGSKNYERYYKYGLLDRDEKEGPAYIDWRNGCGQKQREEFSAK